MNAPLLLAVTVLAAYLVGAVPFGYLVARGRGIDIFKHGSGNIGATNVGRVLGRRFGILVFVLDFAKGALPVLAARWLARTTDDVVAPEVLEVAAGLAAFLGHLFPVYLRFRGGKGVATGAGVMVVLVPGPALGALLTWLVVAASFRYVSLASVLAGIALCVLRLAHASHPWEWPGTIVTFFCLLGAALVAARHHANLRRLLHGTENRLPENPAMLLLSKTLHVLALGLWFGSTVFFSFVVALSLFHTFEEIAEKEERPLWFPLAKEYNQMPPSQKFPDPLRKDQGTRAAGAAIGPMFRFYFGIEAGCAAVATLTALSWWNDRPGRGVHRARVLILILALVTVGLGMRLNQYGDELNRKRYEATERVLVSPAPSTAEIQAAEEARSEFGRWHGISFSVNLLTVLLVTAAMALAAQLPQATPGEGEGKTPLAA